MPKKGKLLADRTDRLKYKRKRSKESQKQASKRKKNDSEKHRLKCSEKGKFYNVGRKDNELNEHYIGQMSEICEECQSINFKAERPDDGKFSLCCHKGKVKIKPLKQYPSLLKTLLTDKTDSRHKNFTVNIRSYNSALAFASMGASFSTQKTQNIKKTHGPFCYRIHGQIYHRASPLHPKEGDQPKYAQLYILDSDEALECRLNSNENLKCDPKIMKMIDTLLRTTNKFALADKMMREVELEEEKNAKIEGRVIEPIRMVICSNRKNDYRRYNPPRSNEVAIVFNNVDGEPPFERDLKIHLRSEHKTVPISILNPNCDPMVYPILFPNCEQGWNSDLKTDKLVTNKRITLLQFYSYRLSIRKEFNPILNAGKLTQQYIVDAYVKIEGNNLNFIRNNQNRLRLESYTGLMHHVYNDGKAKTTKAGIQCILPSSFCGSPRAKQQNCQDAMAIVRKYGKPDLFITMTCNPQWKEITENLESWQSSADRPDLIARVFKLKLEELKKDLMENHVLGVCVAYIYVIEFQKRGLPHAHILIVLRDEDKPRTCEIIDQIVCAEIPDPQNHKRLHEIVIRNMIHGPCGKLNTNSPCMIDGICSKGFPKEFAETTKENVNGYPQYKRRFSTQVYKVRGHSIDNSWVVPYNKYLLLKYNCHINVEICASIKSIKYLFKYVYKGYDCAEIEFRRNPNEVDGFLDARYISAPEAIWRIFQFKMQKISHSIIRLAVHLPHEQYITFKEGEEREALKKASRKDTTLTAWFKLNQQNKNANNYLYTEIPEHFVFDSNTSWKPREKFKKLISRMYTVNLIETERYYLRLLLLHVKGATSFESLKTYKNIIYKSFQEAAIARNLLTSDNEWEEALEEAGHFQMPIKLRQLFALICIFGTPNNARAIWDKFLNILTEDIVHKNIKDPEAYAMRQIENILRIHGKSFVDFNLPKPTSYEPDIHLDSKSEKIKGEKLLAMLNDKQKIAYNKIMDAIYDKSKPNCFFIDGPGGSGKTFLYNTLMSVLRGKNKIVIPVASTGIAATLLERGRTYHSQFKLSIPITERTTSCIRENSEDGQLLIHASLIIWDEATMATHHALRAVDFKLRDLMKNKKKFGGKVILLGGDFRQCLPVVKHAHKVAVIQMSLKYSPLWPNFEQLKLHKNMRTTTNNGSNDKFDEWLIKLGDGLLNDNDSNIEIPNNFIVKDNIIDYIYGSKISIDCIETLADRAILCPKNDSTQEINNEIVSRIEGDDVTYLSIDSLLSDNEEERALYPVEVLNSLNIAGLPPHKLTLKNGCIIMLLRNLNTRAKLCNGTRLIIKELRSRVIVADILNDTSLGERVFIPRIDLTSDDEFPIKFNRRQFPIKLAFAMTINKSQGQTFQKVGIYLSSPVFSHGQLYVAFSRARSKENVYVQIVESERQGRIKEKSQKMFTINCVYKEIFDRDFCFNLDDKTLPIIENVCPQNLFSSDTLEEGDSSNSIDSDITLCYLEDSEIHIDLSARAEISLISLLHKNAYEDLDKLYNIWHNDGHKALADEIINYIRSFSERVYSNEVELDKYYSDIIKSEHRNVLNKFYAVETEALGDCFYHSTSIALIGNGSLATAFRLAIVAKIIEYKELLKTRILRPFYENFKKQDGNYYICKLEDMAFSAGISRTFFQTNVTEIRFPDHLIEENLLENEMMTIHYATLFHQYIASMVTNRPMHCYGVNKNWAQRLLWSYEYENCSPICYIHVCGNHFIGLLPASENITKHENYHYYCFFLNEQDNTAYKNRPTKPSNEILN